MGFRWHYIHMGLEGTLSGHVERFHGERFYPEPKRSLSARSQILPKQFALAAKAVGFRSQVRPFDVNYCKAMACMT